MSDLVRLLKQTALRKRDEKGEVDVKVSEKSFIEWKAADRIEALTEANTTMLLMGAKSQKRIAELEAALQQIAKQRPVGAEAYIAKQALGGDDG